MKQKQFEKSVVDGIQKTLDNPENFVIDSGYYTGGNRYYQTEYYVFSRKDNNVIFFVKPDTYGGKLTVAGNEINVSRDNFDRILNSTHTTFISQPQNSTQRKKSLLNPMLFLKDYVSFVEPVWMTCFEDNEEYEQNMVRAIANVLNNPKNVIYNGIKQNSDNHRSVYYVYSGNTKQRLYFVEYSPLLRDQYIINVNYEHLPMSLQTSKNIFDITQQRYDKSKRLSETDEHQQFTLQYLSDYAKTR